MKIDKNTINKIARLSRIKLDDKESEDYIKDLNSILDWVEQLNEVNTENDFQMKWETSDRGKKVIKEITDAAKKSENLYLATDPDREGFFAVPKVVE